MPRSRTTSDLSIRMYRVGFGDCFLVTLPQASGPAYVLLDCGVHPSGDIGTMAQAIADIEATTGGKLALLIASHEHADHISGFGAFRDRFANLDIGEVWMPWAMDPGDPIANALRIRRLTLVETLRKHFAAVGGPPGAGEALLNMSAVSNDAAVTALRGGFTDPTRVRYLKGGDAAQPPAGLEGLGIRVLGPPTDEAFLKKMDPPASQRYFKMQVGGAKPVNALSPFAARFWLDPKLGRKQAGFSAAEERGLEDGILGSVGDLAFALDSAVNNTSLVLLLSFRGVNLLFPGDAQYGSWKSWIDDADATTLLQQVSFLKVAHHGSLNATPKSALEAMTTGGFAAMVSTQVKPWPSIPYAPLMARLAQQSSDHVVRSDSLPDTGAPQGPSLDALPSGFRHDDGKPWLDYVIRVPGP